MLLSHFKAYLLASSFLFTLSQCHTSSGRDGHGLIGYGINMYFPACCTACRNVLSASQLSCSEAMEMDHSMMMMDMAEAEFETSAECYASDDVFLQSLAVCISQRCPTDPSSGGLKDWQIEQWWQKNVAGRFKVQPDPKISYAMSLARVQTMPNETLTSGDPLNRVMLVADADYQLNWNADISFEHSEVLHERYALVVFLSGVIIPIAFSLLRFVPFPSRWTTIFNAYFIDPPMLGQRHKVPILWGLTNMPTRGQGLFVCYLIIINVVLSAVGFSSKQPNAWWPGDSSREILTYLTNRVGVLSFANVPLLILYAGRNNVLLWLTNWRHETFLLVHRYIAGIATLQALLHTVIYLYLYVSDGKHSSESKLAYWIWGAVATISMSILLPTSILPLRRMLYETFLLWHIALSVLAVVGCYLHIYDRFEHQWGYETWIYVAIAVWVFDRLLRVGRLARNGLRFAKITVLDEDYIRVDIEGVGGNGHAYLYFPTLTWRMWENHPFSVVSTVLNAPKSSTSKHISRMEKDGTLAAEVIKSNDSSEGELDDQHTQPSKLAMTFLLRTRGGLTKALRCRSKIPVFVEAPYGKHADLSEYPKLICIAGGVGITTVLPMLQSHPGQSKLLWGVRSRTLVDAMADEMESTDKTVFVGHRMNVRDELERELLAYETAQRAVVMVSGPASMADDVRNALCAIGRRSKNLSVTLLEDSFSW